MSGAGNIFTAARQRWERSSRDGKEGLQQRAVMEKPLAGGGCVERSKAICDVRAVRCRLEPRRLTFPFAQFRRTDYALPRELCQASHSREESARNDSLVLSLPLLSLSLPLPSMLNPPPPAPHPPASNTHSIRLLVLKECMCARTHACAHTHTPKIKCLSCYYVDT